MKTDNLTTSALAILRECIRTNEIRVADLSAKLSIGILVNAGMLVIQREKDGNERVFGEFLPVIASQGTEKIRGWQSLAAVSDGLTGCHMFTRESAEKNVARLNSLASNGETYFARHFREEQERRLVQAHEWLGQFRARLAVLEAGS